LAVQGQDADADVGQPHDGGDLLELLDLQVNRPGSAECGLGHEDGELLGLVQEMVLAAHPVSLLVPSTGSGLMVTTMTMSAHSEHLGGLCGGLPAACLEALTRLTCLIR
jgi:hypothetical protein